MFRTLLVLAAAAAALLEAQPSIDRVVDELAATRRFSDVAISPDGRRVAWVEEVHRHGNATGFTAIYAFDLSPADARPHKVGAARSGSAGARETAPAWSPDGNSLLFLSDAGKPGQPQVYVWRCAPGGKRAGTRRLTAAAGVAASPFSRTNWWPPPACAICRPQRAEPGASVVSMN